MRRAAAVLALLAGSLVVAPRSVDAADCAPRQGVVAVHRMAGGEHHQPRRLTDAGDLEDVDLLGHTGQPPLVAAWSTCGDGTWAVTPEGHVYIGGDAVHAGDTRAQRLNQPVVGMAPTPSGEGYWLVASDGGIFAFGDARYFGSTGAIRLNQPIVAMASTPTGRGYWLVAADGGVFSFGDAAFRGSLGATPLNAPIVGMASTTSGRGYWMVASDGGVFTFGDAVFRGSTASSAGSVPVVALVPFGDGYGVVDRDGTLTTFASTAPTPAPVADGPIISLDDPRVTDEQRQAAQDLIDRTVEGMRAFPDEQAVIDAGFASIGDGASGYEHYVNAGRLLDGRELDEGAIESVVLEVAEDGSKRVASAMYILNLGTEMADVPDIAGELTTWHDHTDLCFAGLALVGLAEDGRCTRGILVVTPPMLHVWLVDHPCGPFAGIETGGHGDGCGEHAQDEHEGH